MFLEIRDVSVAYGAIEVLKRVSLSVARGELVALLGSSGCGKTTLLRAVSGFAQVDRGSIVVDGREVTHLPPEKRDSAMVFQTYALWPNMTVAQNIGFGLKLRGFDRRRIDARIAELLGLLKLDGLVDRNVTQLSGGQRQRVALGRALAINPALLLLDEPLSNLDASIRLELRHEIRAIQQRVGITALHVTHDREEAMVMADKIVVLNGGRIEQIGTPQEVYHRPGSPFVATFMGADNLVLLDAERDGALVRLRHQGGEGVTAPSERLGGIARGGRAEVSGYFRSDAATLVGPGEAAEAQALLLPGRVAQTSYLGSGWRHFVECAGRRITVDGARDFPVGSDVRVAVPTGALHLFERQA